MSRMSRRIVVDASIVGAASERDHPVSSLCREFLLDMLKICHKAVVSDEIIAEWNKHISRFSVSWQASMRAKRKLVKVNPASPSNLLRRILDSEEWSVRQVGAIEKDMLLIEAALETDRLIASCDSTARNLLVTAAGTVGEIAGIVWVSPIDDDDDCPSWLRSGARYVSSMSLVGRRD